MNPTTPTSQRGKTTAPAWARGLVAAATASSALARRALVKLTGREPDCWRRTIGLGLRSEATRFGLASLGLALEGDESLAAASDALVRRLAAFLVGEPAARWALEPRRHWVERIPWPRPDLVLADFADDGTLRSLAPCLHPTSPVELTASQQAAVADAIVAAHAATRSLPEAVRPGRLLAGERAISLLVDFVNFTPLLRWRAHLNAELRPRFDQALPVSALLLWCLAQQPEFAGRRFATAVDVPAQGRHARAVDLVAIRPADYFGRRGGLAEFVRDYLELTAAARRRATRSYAAMRWLALASPAGTTASSRSATYPCRPRAVVPLRRSPSKAKPTGSRPIRRHCGAR